MCPHMLRVWFPRSAFRQIRNLKSKICNLKFFLSPPVKTDG